VNITEGQTAKEVYDRATRRMTPIDFQVRCDKFDVSYYPNSGRVKDYTSVLTVIDGGKEVLTETIEVNSPLIYKGYYFYQSSYGRSGLQGAYVTVAGPDRNYIFTNTFLANGKRLNLPGGSELVIRDIWEDQSNSGAPAGLIFGIASNGQLTATGRAFEASMGRPWWQVGQYQIRVDKIDWLEYTGLQVARDPGVPIIWAGCVLITLGLMVSFFISHRRVWVRVSPGERGVTVSLAGNASRNRVSFETWFKGLCEDIQEGFEKKNG
jgi:cytochrome c biogenesis protein